MSDDLPKRLRQLAKEMTEGDPKTASMLVLSAKELERLYVPREPSGMQMMMVGEATGTARDSVIEECAAVAEGWMRDMNQKSHGAAIGASIRALKGGISNPTTKGETNGPA